MRLVRARIKGFQSFSDSGDIEFEGGINLIIGQNNAGKSALLRALLPILADDRHRTPARFETHTLASPEINLTLDVSGPEIKDWILRSGGPQYFPLPVRQGAPPPDGPALLKRIFESNNLFLRVTHRPQQSFLADYPSHGLFEAFQNTGGTRLCAVATPVGGDIQTSLQVSDADTLPGLLFSAWSRDMFYFAPERMTVGEAPQGYSNRLVPNASNLPNILLMLAAERGDTFSQLIHHLREIFPTVGNISTRTKPENNFLEVRVWPTEAMERVELSFPLNSSGTGVSQVIALLTAIMTLDNAVVIIDEINSFLHPAAVKALLRILQARYADHQYIISTHAPEVIGFANPKTIQLVKRVGYESSIERLNLAEVGKFREVAEHLGVSMADVFAAERVIWVEGPTEELCFPYLYQQLIGPLPRGTIFTSVAATGDFNSNKRDPAIVYEVYKRLSAAAANLIVSVAFSFDTEKLTVSEKEKMRRDSGGLLQFLPRRHLECYLVDPAAIAAFIVRKDPVSEGKVTLAHVRQSLEDAAKTQQFRIKEWADDIGDVDWLTHVDAANLIDYACGVLSEYRAPFNKKDDSLFLLQHIIEHNSDALSPLRDYVAGLVSSNQH
ncbi:AAA family ATPase [Rhizobium sp. BK491]|uniref:AAA family ATPase n=1 Tax=unclassified Rhizobium TaxID=2613769 RepID=UPI000DDB0494|nr:putative ATPase [Rhizobium sp. BK491]